jgi:hypothetical protein
MDILNRKPEPRRIGTAEESVSEGAEKTVSEEAAAAEEQGLPQEQTASGEQAGSEGQTSPAAEE